MYCSKLVYYAYYEVNRNSLNSHRTQTWTQELKEDSWNFVGVTPDDIWGSDWTTPYKDFVNGSMLNYLF
jgi:hypothetical protein